MAAMLCPGRDGLMAVFRQAQKAIVLCGNEEDFAWKMRAIELTEVELRIHASIN